MEMIPRADTGTHDAAQEGNTMARHVSFTPGSRMALLSAVLLTLSAVAGHAQTVLDEWAGVTAPPPPALKDASVPDGKATAVLVMDINGQTCSAQRRPRCANGMPRLQKLVADARSKGALIIYTLTSSATAADILKEVAPQPGDPVLKSAGPDKFMGNDMEKILRERGIKTVIATGTAAHTSVLHTGSGAALRGYDVIVPVDVISSDLAYQEQYTLHHLTVASRVMNKVTLTTTARLKF